VGECGVGHGLDPAPSVVVGARHVARVTQRGHDRSITHFWLKQTAPYDRIWCLAASPATRLVQSQCVTWGGAVDVVVSQRQRLQPVVVGQVAHPAGQLSAGGVGEHADGPVSVVVGDGVGGVATHQHRLSQIG
jgi:hypothetical protein